MSHFDKILDREQEPNRGDGAENAAFVERLQIILGHWPSADRLARAMSVSPSAFRKWLKGEAEPSRERLVALARTSGVGVAWLAEGEGPEPVFEPVVGATRRPQVRDVDAQIDGSNYVLLPRDTDSARPSAPGAPRGGAFMALRHDWVRSVLGVDPDRLVLETTVGEAMAPTIRDGTLLLIDTTDKTARHFGIYMLEIAGERMVRRVQRKHDGSLVLISDNRACLPDAIDKTAVNEVSVVGRVVWAGGAL
jgi:phage repressor protein C with HTH and peptisase S24 domain